MIRFDNVCLRYQRDSRNVLENITMDISPGSFYFITGNSGAGKTSLLRLIFLTHRPTRGDVFLFGTNVTKLARRERPLLRRQIGVIFQDFRLLDHLTIYENVALPRQVAGGRDSQYRDDVVELLEWVGLGAHIDSYPATLSGGEQQRAAIARAVISQPSLIIADEPTGNVDPDMGARLVRLLDELHRRGTTILVATHDQNLWSQFHHPQLHLENGLLQSRGAEIVSAWDASSLESLS